MEQLKDFCEFEPESYDRHTVVGLVGNIHLESTLKSKTMPQSVKKNKAPRLFFTFHEYEDHFTPTNSYHLVALEGSEALKALEMNLSPEDFVLLELKNLEPKAYRDDSVSPPRAVAYFFGKGSELVILRNGPKLTHAGQPEVKPKTAPEIPGSQLPAAPQSANHTLTRVQSPQKISNSQMEAYPVTQGSPRGGSDDLRYAAASETGRNFSAGIDLSQTDTADTIIEDNNTALPAARKAEYADEH
jgi:hypothetical protein